MSDTAIAEAVDESAAMDSCQATTRQLAARPLSMPAWVRRVASFPAFMAVCLVVTTFGICTQWQGAHDTGWHVRVGEEILNTHTWPAAETYSFTANGHPWIAYEWLGEVLLALAARAGDFRGLLVLGAAQASIFVLLLAYLCYLRARNSKSAIASAGLLLPIASAFFVLRPQLLGYIFVVSTLICLEHFRQGQSRALWILPPLFVVWANAHGSFAFGLGLIGLHWASGLVKFEYGGVYAERWTTSQSRQLLAVMLLCVLATLATPYGARLAAYPFEMALLQPLNIANISEWLPLGSVGSGVKIFLAFLLPFMAALIALRPRYRLHELAFLLFTIYAACVHVRFLMLFVIAFAPLLGEMLARWIPPYDRAKDRYALNAVLMAVAVVAIFKIVPSSQAIEAQVKKDYPVDAVRYLQQHPVAGPMLNEYGWGGYLIWKNPGHKVFIDGRADVYEYAGVLSDYLDLMRLKPNATFVVEKYGIRSCLIMRDSPLATMLAAIPGWSRVYQDELSAVFVRTPAKPQK